MKNEFLNILFSQCELTNKFGNFHFSDVNFRL